MNMRCPCVHCPRASVSVRASRAVQNRYAQSQSRQHQSVPSDPARPSADQFSGKAQRDSKRNPGSRRPVDSNSRDKHDLGRSLQETAGSGSHLSPHSRFTHLFTQSWNPVQSVVNSTVLVKRHRADAGTVLYCSLCVSRLPHCSPRCLFTGSRIALHSQLSETHLDARRGLFQGEFGWASCASASNVYRYRTGIPAEMRAFISAPCIS